MVLIASMLQPRAASNQAKLASARLAKIEQPTVRKGSPSTFTPAPVPRMPGAEQLTQKPTPAMPGAQRLELQPVARMSSQYGRANYAGNEAPMVPEDPFARELAGARAQRELVLDLIRASYRSNGITKP